MQVNPDKPNILFIDDEERILRSVRLMFRRSHNVFTTTDPNEFRQLAIEHNMSVIVCDQRMPKVTGTELLCEVKELAPNSMRILLTGYADMEAVIDAINQGQIYRYITKPWKADELRRVINEATAIAQTTSRRVEESQGSGNPHINESIKLNMMVMFENNEIYQRFQSEFGHRYNIFWAKDIKETMKILEEHTMSVVVTDVHFCNHKILSVVNALKKVAPQVMTIVITKHQDSQMFIRLINEGQIFRCLMRPVSKSDLAENIDQAAQQSRYILANPEVSQRFKVENITEEPTEQIHEDMQSEHQAEDDSSLLKKLIDKIRISF